MFRVSQSIIKFEIISNDKIKLFLSDGHYFCFENKQMETERTSSLLSEIKEVWQKMLSWERMLLHQRNGRIRDLPNLIDSLFVLLICIAKNTQVSIFPNGHFQPTPFLFLSNAPSLTLLNHCSLSLSLFTYSPLYFTCCGFT